MPLYFTLVMDGRCRAQKNHRAGSLLIRSSGTAEVGKIEVHGRGKLARVRVEGNLGSLSTDVNVGRVFVAGVFGTLASAAHQIHRLLASVFDGIPSELAHVHVLKIDQDMMALLFGRFLEWDGGWEV